MRRMVSKERREGRERRAAQRAKVIMSNPLFTHSTAGDVQIIELALPLNIDAGQFDFLNDRVGQLVDERANARWVLDLGRVEYTGSAMLGLLVNLRQRIKQQGGSLVLCR